MEEIKNLCQDLEIDINNLGGEGREGKARELIAFIERRSRLDALIVELQQLRPEAFEEWGFTTREQSPVMPPIKYQINALEQLLKHWIVSTGTRQLPIRRLNQMLQNPLFRDGINPLFEPLNLLLIEGAIRKLQETGKLQRTE